MQDRSIAVWDMQSPTDINLRRVLVGHRAAVNVVDFDQKYIVSASGDRTIKVSSFTTWTLSVESPVRNGVKSNEHFKYFRYGAHRHVNLYAH